MTENKELKVQAMVLSLYHLKLYFQKEILRVHVNMGPYRLSPKCEHIKKDVDRIKYPALHLCLDKLPYCFPLWRDMRYGRIKASKLYEASRCSTTEGSLVNVILGASKVKNNVAMERGIRLEKDVLKEVERKLRTKINRSGLILMPENPIFGASPDGISENAVFEVKCPVSEKSFKTYFNDDETMPADKYLAQIMLQMYMCNKDLGFFCVARPCFEKSKDILILKVVYNEAWLQSVMIKAKEFWISSLFPKLNVSA
uniref:YqaJ viral recombinase domain-containing protein n=1 Tax=Cacopsylla melanoneura TaxID=428564 RepID=A0A8D9E9N4_9HEMI